MKELNDIVRAYDEAGLSDKKTLLATVVKVTGSSYRRPGARMLVTEDGIMTGAISGGCLEGDALRKAQLAIFEGKNRLEIYDTTDDEDNNLGVQLGCNGIVYILFEPIIATDPDNPIHLFRNLTGSRKDAVLVTVFNEDKNAHQQGTCALLTQNHSICSHHHEYLLPSANTSLLQRISMVEKYSELSVLYQFVPPAIQLVIAGAGNDVQPLAAMASLLGWHLIVADGRPAYATKQRFPTAKQILVAKPAGIISEVKMDAHTAIVLMTHNYNYDVELLRHLHPTPCSYIGILGPRKKLHKMLDELIEQGIVFNNDRLFGPVGLDIGAETAEEIALSVMSEIQAVFAGRQGSSLRERQTDIHTRNEALQYG